MEPVVGHAATGEPLAGPFVLLWARGDQLDWALDRLHSITEDPDAGRHERTTTVPLLEQLRGVLPQTYVLEHGGLVVDPLS